MKNMEQNRNAEASARNVSEKTYTTDKIRRQGPLSVRTRIESGELIVITFFMPSVFCNERIKVNVTLQSLNIK